MYRFLILLVVSAALSGVFSACARYDEGPKISFVSRMERITNVWRVDYVEDNTASGIGYPYTLENFERVNLRITLERSGLANIRIDTDAPDELMIRGTWDFRDKDRRIEWRWETDIPGFAPVFNSSPVWRIRMLRESQLHLTSDDGRFRIHMQPMR